MKKSTAYIQSTIMNEMMKVYNTRNLADKVLKVLSPNDDRAEIYSTQEDCIVFRRKRDNDFTDNEIIHAFAKGAVKLMNSDKSVIEDINDNYEFEYDDKYLDDAYFSAILEIRRKGRLISVEIDLQ